MKTNEVMTREQQDFAAEHHNLIYTFLNAKQLKEDDFYDVVVFGYLRAVRRYLGQPELRVYAFSTIAWYAMKCEMGNYFHRETRRAQHLPTVSLDALGDGYAEFTADILFGDDRMVEALDASLQWEQVTEALTKAQADVLQLTAGGYTAQEIASKWRRPLPEIERLCADALSNARLACAM